MNAPEFAVRRPRLERILDEGARRRLTTVVAPAGYGKSVLLGQWASTRLGALTAWLTIDERDADPVRLGTRLVAALSAARPEVGERGSAALRKATTRLGDEVIDLLLENLQAVDDDIVVVLDDLDRLEGPSVEDLGRLIEEAPSRVHFMIASRSDPSIPRHRLRSRGELVEPRADDLRFTESEAQQVIERVSGHRLSNDEIAHLVDLTEGWPVAVELAALSLRGAQDASALIGFGGTDRTVIDYLSAEVLEQEPPELRSFLLDVSVLEEVSGELADVVTGRADGARLLQVLVQRGLFVRRVPGDAGWLRLHRLVREFLRHDLRTSDPARPALLLGRAAEWWLEHDDPSSAATCLIAARAWDRLIDLVYEYGRVAWDRGAARTVITWIEAVPAAVRHSNVRLRLVHAALDLIVGGGARAAVAVADLERDAELTPGEQLAADLVMCSLVTMSGPRADTLMRADRARAASREIPAVEVLEVLNATNVHSVTAIAGAAAALARLLVGDGAALDEAARSLQAPDETPAVGRVNALGAAALVEALAGRTERAAALAQLAADRADGTLSVDHPASIFWRTALTVIARLRDDLDEADDRAREALEVAIQWRRWPFVALLLGEQGMIDLARGEPVAALARLRDRATFPMPPAGPMVEGRLRSIELRAGLALGDGDDTVSALDPDLVGGSWELAAGAVAADLTSGRVDRARKHLEEWPPGAAPFGEIELELCTALVELAEGDAPAACARAAALLHRTDRDAVIRPYLDVGEPVIALLEAVAREHPSRHLDEVLGRARQAHTPRIAFVDPLSSRELEVLRYLPTRMGNAEIARALYVSTNTIKTHVKHIYQKLAAADRDDAVRIARESGLL